MRKNVLGLMLLLTASLALGQSLAFVRTRFAADVAPPQRSQRARAAAPNFRHALGAPRFAMPLSGTTFVVTTAADNLDNNNPTPGSLRAAIRDANLSPGADTIEFNLPGAGPHTINAGAGMPDIKDTVTIDGYTQPGASANTLADGDDAVLKIEIKGQANLFGKGLVIAASDCVVQGLSIHGFNHAVYITGERTVAGANGNIVRGNFIGTNINGTAVSVDYGDGTGNGGGVYIDGGGFKPNGDPGTANNNVIGGTTPAARNVISGNGSFGVQVSQNIASATATGNVVQGNLIGTNAAGTAALGNGDGIIIYTPGNTVGGTAAGARNVISGNNYNPFISDGVNIDGVNAHHNIVQGNLIGTDATGTAAIPNAVHGVNINNTAHDNTVGGTTPAARNIISGNVQSGVALGNNTANNLVKGNYLGTDVTGTAALGNRFNGVFVGQAASATVGGTEPGAGNVISANARGGVDIGGSNIVVQGNLIGTKADGAGPLGNAQYGVRVFGPNNLIGGRTAGAGNVIAFSRFADPFSDAATGVIVSGGNTNATVAGNSIHSNEGLGLDLGRNGLTANDTCDGDSSDGTSNRLQNYPVLTSAASGGGATTVAGTLDSAPGTTFTLDFYASAACDVSGFGEGQTYLGSGVATTDPNCHATFNVALPVVVPAGQVVTATATDPSGNTSEFSACVQVTLTNSPPDAINDAVTTDEDTPVTISVLANDTDPDGDALSVSSFTQGANGSVVSNGDGTLTYTPAANYNGTDSFTYSVSDGQGGTDSASVNINVNAVSDPPGAFDDAASTNEDIALSVNVLANDAGGDCDGLNVTAVTQGAHGSVSINPDNTVRYTPAANFNGTDSFTYTVDCANAGSFALKRTFTSAGARKMVSAASIGTTATVRVTVTPVNDAPIASTDNYSVDEDGALNVPAPGVLANDTDAEGDALTSVHVTGPSRGRLTLNPDGSFTYTPNANYNGPDSFTYQAQDAGGALSNVGTVIITVNSVNDAPVAEDQAVTTNEDTIKFIFITATDADGDPLTYSIVTRPEHGTLTGGGRNLTYTPAANYGGPDFFTFKANDGTVDSNIATVTITVTSVNDAPDAVNDSATLDEDASVTVNVLANDTDAEGDALTIVSVTRPTKGSVVANPDGTLTYTPRLNQNGTDSFSYTVSDGNGGADAASVFITITPVNDPPIARNDAATTQEDTSVYIDVLVNDSDVDSDAPSLQGVTQPAHGSVWVNADKTVRYGPSLNFNGTDSFTYTISDAQGATATATVSVNVTPVNDPPVAVDDNYTTDINTTLTVAAPGVLANDSDVDGDPLTTRLMNAPVHGALSLNADGSFTYTPNANFSGCDTFDYQSRDRFAAFSNTVTVTIIINPAPDPLANSPFVLNQSALSASFNLMTAADSLSPRSGKGAAPLAAQSSTSDAPTWNKTANLGTTRVFHTATLLRDGKVLVVGGTSNAVKEFFTGKSFLKSAEVYDPATGTWRRTGDLNTARANHTATLLPDGRVLVAGGVGDNGVVLKTSEVYDPATGVWTRTRGSLNAARAVHTATLVSSPTSMPEGKVLIAGGVGGNLSILDSAEVYDPATDAWTRARSLRTGRWAHTASNLPNGRVLIAGGYGAAGSVIQNTAEVYDPAADTWTRTRGNLNSARSHHTATRMLDGKVLLTGGLGLNGILNNAEVYDPLTDAFTSTQGRLHTGRWLHTATLLRDGRVLVAGGNTDNNFGHAATDAAEVYDPASGAWAQTANLVTGRHSQTASLLYNNKVLVTGGMHAAATLAKAELYDTLDTRRLFSTCSGVVATQLHGEGFHGNTRISRIENGTVPCMNHETGELSQCQFSTDDARPSGIWLEAADGQYAQTGQGISLQGEPGGEWIVAARVNDDGTVPCVAPSGHDTQGVIQSGSELPAQCLVEEPLAEYNAFGIYYESWLIRLINYATLEVCTSSYPHPDDAEPIRTITSCSGAVYCYIHVGAALNDINGTERDESSTYYGGADRCHMIENGSFEVPGAKRPATISFPAPGRVNVHTPLVWRPVNPNIRIAN